MQELIGMNVKINMNDTHGFITIVGKVIKLDQNLILLDSTIGPIYVCFHSIKTIQIKGDTHEEE